MQLATYDVFLQAKRLVRNSILSVETTDTQVDDVEFADDAAEVEDFVRSHRDGDDASGSGPGQGKRCQHACTFSSLM